MTSFHSLSGDQFTVAVDREGVTVWHDIGDKTVALITFTHHEWDTIAGLVQSGRTACAAKARKALTVV